VIWPAAATTGGMVIITTRIPTSPRRTRFVLHLFTLSVKGASLSLLSEFVSFKRKNYFLLRGRASCLAGRLESFIKIRVSDFYYESGKNMYHLLLRSLFKHFLFFFIVNVF
jgi:hypothetical protein